MRRVAVSAVLGVALVATACGGGSNTASAGSIASLDPAESSADLAQPADPEDSEATFEEAQFEFAACMRETFPEWPDPDPDSQGGRLGFDPQALQALDLDFGSESFRATLDQCSENFQGVAGGGPDLTAEEQAELEDQLLALFACVRETPGFESLPDPDFDQAAGFGIRDLLRAGEFDAQLLRSTMQDCATDLGMEDGLRGGPGGGQGGGFGGPRAGQGDDQPEGT